ncbi:MAG: exodeoxyribonuclease VII large subunit [Gemmatimonadetes bacterium]|nr:exodeoxyribonuclease VII large subunit [Gemmatimonadota bacterium]
MGGLDLFSGGAAASADGAWSVAQVTAHARKLVEAAFVRLWVRGEVTGFKAYRSGHWYFSLRDRQAQVRCVMWRTDNQAARTQLEDGMEVFVEARPTVWEERGEFRLTVKQLIPTDTGGLWQLQLEKAKAALQRDGLLDPARKRPLPQYPARIAVVTSPDGAALRDIASVVARRWPAVEILVVPVRVQGETAEAELCAGLKLADQVAADLVIVGRGGGSREDLWAFNSERVARAVAAVSVPTISAVGHETDVSLTDLVADVRAATPSAAAEAAVPDRDAVRDRLNALARTLAGGLLGRVELATQRLDRTGDRLQATIAARIDHSRGRLDALHATLHALSPLRVLERGFAVARDADGRVLKHVAQFPGGTEFRLTVSDGDVRARVTDGAA